ncbi:hypothetical protein KHQ81_14420 [Mycoplasmatota bacterium]|nr:hypothetical protein KHQ81_14420 [Mycoplasmatota bacterium]
MKKNTFKKLFSNGRGKALQFLREISPNTEKYEEIIVTICSTFTGLNFQSEGCNPDYYLEAISLCKNKDLIVEKVQYNLFSNTNYESIQKTFTILLHLSTDYSFLVNGLKEYLMTRLIIAKYDLGDYPRYNRDLFLGLCHKCLDHDYDLGKLAMQLFMELCKTKGHEANIDEFELCENDYKYFWPVVKELGYFQIISDAHNKVKKMREEYQNSLQHEKRKRPKEKSYKQMMT